MHTRHVGRNDIVHLEQRPARVVEVSLPAVAKQRGEVGLVAHEDLDVALVQRGRRRLEQVDDVRERAVRHVVEERGELHVGDEREGVTKHRPTKKARGRLKRGGRQTLQSPRKHTRAASRERAAETRLFLQR